MGTIKQVDGKNEFEIHYGGEECPFTGGGLDSSAPPPYIQKNSFIEFQNAFIKDNSIVAGVVAQINTVPFAFTFPNAISIGFGDLNGVMFEVQFDPAASTNGTLYVYSYGTSGTFVPTLIGTFVLTTNIGGLPGKLTFKNINGVCYFSAPGLYDIYTHNNVAATILSDYLGCSYLGELNGRLIALNIAQLQFTGPTLFIQSPTTIDASGTVNTPTTTTFTSGTAAFSAQAIPSLDYSINLAMAYNASVVFSGVGTGQVILNLQYSPDSGTTWITFYTTTYTQPSTGQYFQQISFGNITNTNTILTRVQAVTTVYASGSITVDFQAYQSVLTGGPFGTPIINYFPYQVAWSAAEEAYGIFNPLTVDGLVTGAGFNNIPDVEDNITGFFTTGTTGYILRNQGISEMTPLNNGIEPFDFNHLWASHNGIGAKNNVMAQQYGSVGYFISDTNGFTIGYDGIATFVDRVKSIVYAELLNSALSFNSAIGVISINNEPFLAWVLAWIDTHNVLNYFIYRADNKEWYQGSLAFIGITNPTLNLTAVTLPSLGLSLTSSILFNVQAKQIAAPSFTTNIYGFDNLPIIPIGGSSTDATTLIFKAEELGFGKYPTCDSIGLYLYSPVAIDFTNLNIAVSINGITFELISMETGTDSPTPVTQINAGWNYYFCYPTDDNPYTGITPQLSIILGAVGIVDNQQFVLGKAVIFGTIDATQRPT